MITTVQCSICSQLNNKTRVYVVVTEFRLHHTCSIITIAIHRHSPQTSLHTLISLARGYLHCARVHELVKNNIKKIFNKVGGASKVYQ